MALSCKLPVASADAPMDGDAAHGGTGHGGFIQFPSGAFTPDPASLGTYDRALSKWLPVRRDWVSTDGKRYAFSFNPAGAAGPVTGKIHIVDASSGSERSVVVPSTSNVVSFEPEGVYIAHVVPSSGAPPTGLTLVNPDTAAFNQITAEGTWTAIGGGFAWGADLDPAIQAPASPGPGAANRIRKLDLKTGAVATAAEYPGSSVQVLGVQAGQAVVASGPAVNGPAYSITRLDGTKLYAADVTSSSNPTSPIVSDGGALWFSSLSPAVWRWADPSAGISQVATGPAQGAVVAGTCS